MLRGLDQVREFDEREVREFQADVFLTSIDWQIGDNLTLTSITSLVEYDKQDWLDPDASSFAIFSDLRQEYFEQSAQELRLSSSADQTFEWMAGLYWQEDASIRSSTSFCHSTFGRVSGAR